MKDHVSGDEAESARRRQTRRIAPEQEEKLLEWLCDGLDIRTAQMLFKQEFKQAIAAESIVSLWKKHSARLHLERRKRFAQIASEIVENTLVGEEALDAANAYLLKQTLFECLIEPEKDSKQIEILVKAIKSLALACDDKTRTENAAEKGGEGLTEKTLEEIEEMIKIL
ncbi:MAG: hypothetical protein N2487_01715 [Verrucomicrobiae bacterium]|nr:hypothetical protein [Verrucomicrobiae bacterium]